MTNRKEGLAEILARKMSSPEGARRQRERIRHRDEFLQTSLLPQIREGAIRTTDDVYDLLEGYRQEYGADITITQIFGKAAETLYDRIKRLKEGNTPFDFYEIDFALSLLSEAIAENDRFFSEPGSTPEKEVEGLTRAGAEHTSRFLRIQKDSLNLAHD